MLSKKLNSNEIFINDNYKSRYVSVPCEKYADFLNKIKNKKNLSSYEDSMYAPTYTIKVSTKKYLSKSEPYDIRGKFLELFVDYNGRTKLREIELTRKDGFTLDEYKPIDKYLLSFIKNKHFYEDNNILYKAGLLFYGPPGNGKTSYVRHLKLNQVLPKDTIFIWCKALPGQDLLQELKKIDALKIFIFEEITTVLRGSVRLDEFLQFCDGESTIPNSVVFCMTNHPELLPENLTNRPSRFNKIIEFKNPNKKARELILKLYFKDAYKDEMLSQTEDLSLDQIKESFIISVTGNVAFGKAVDTVRKHKQTVKDSFNEYKAMGIKIGGEDEED